MALPKQTARSELIRKFRALGFTGPVQGRGRHPHMKRGKHKPTIPGEHRQMIPVWLLRDILRKAGIDDDTWNGA